MSRFFGVVATLAVIAALVYAYIAPKDVYLVEMNQGRCVAFHVREWADGLVRQVVEHRVVPEAACS